MTQSMPAADHEDRGSIATRNWTLAVLTTVAFLAATDKQAFTVLLVPIQQELHVSDRAMGFLTGSAFAVAQAIFAVPLGWLSDRTNRRNLLAIAVAVWSCATAISGLASLFVTLLLARVIVGAAEGAQTPTTVSLVADLFAPNRRGTAFMFCAIGTAFGVALGAFTAGYLSDHHNWHFALFVVGAPGLVVALVMFLTVPEPRRIISAAARAGDVPPSSFREQLRQCFSIPTLPPFIFAMIALQGAYSGWVVWYPAFLMRTYHFTGSQMGAAFGVIVLCSVLSAIWGGVVSDRLARRGPRWRLYFLIAVALASAPLLLGANLLLYLPAAQLCVIGYSLLAGCLQPVAMAAYASMSPPKMRAFISAIIYLSGALFGSAAAPILFGFVNDTLVGRYGDQSLRYTLSLAPPMLIVAALFFWIASRTIDADTAAAELEG